MGVTCFVSVLEVGSLVNSSLNREKKHVISQTGQSSTVALGAGVQGPLDTLRGQQRLPLFSKPTMSTLLEVLEGWSPAPESSCPCPTAPQDGRLGIANGGTQDEGRAWPWGVRLYFFYLENQFSQHLRLNKLPLIRR